MVLLQRRAAARTTRARGHQRPARLSLLLLLRAARAAAAQRFQFSLGGGSRGGAAVGDVDGRLHRGRCAGVGSFSYAHGKHHGR